MSRLRAIPCFVATVLLLAPFCRAQGSSGSAVATDQAPPEVRVIGASLSQGAPLSSVEGRLMFASLNRDPRYRTHSIGLLAVLRSVYEDLAVTGTPTKMFFQDPFRYGKAQVDSCDGGVDNLVIGIDFLVWYGYSHRKAGFADLAESLARKEEADGLDLPSPAPGEMWRLAIQCEGLSQLERVLEQSKGILILGDYPNMSDADPQMLPARAIPKQKTLEALNQRLLLWAADKPRVHVFPLAQMVRELEGGVTVELDGEQLELEREHMLQHDGLHPTRLGVAYLTFRLVDWLRTVLPEGQATRPEEWTLEELIEVTEAEEDVEVARRPKAPVR